MDDSFALNHTRAALHPAASSRAKRALDTLLALIGIVVLAPLAIVIAIAIRLDSRGGAIFVQERVGLGGRRFRVLKFRTMYTGADEARHREFVRGMIAKGRGGGEVHKLTDDDRITRVGRFLRRTSLDELPQLWNVLRGEMSIVGPRPPLPYEVELYDAAQRVRLEIRPGITGLWQVSGRNLLDYNTMCEIDAEYVRRWSFGLDLRILLKTIPVVLTNSGHAH